MSKKKLPKAITRNADEIARKEPEQAEPKQASADQLQVTANDLPARPSTASGKREGTRPEPPFIPPSPAAPFQQEQIPTAAVGLSPGSISGSDANERPATTVATGPSQKGDFTNKRAEARRIVNRYSGYSALGGLIPIALIDTAGITAIAVQMARTLSRHYGVPPDPTQTRALVMGMIGGVAPPTLATLSLSTFLRFVPGANLLALTISSATAAACVRSLGENLIEEFEQITEGSNGS